ncbi:MAG: PepSY domain-containing protein [Gammaproteobacteria bacterium]
MKRTPRFCLLVLVLAASCPHWAAAQLDQTLQKSIVTPLLQTQQQAEGRIISAEEAAGRAQAEYGGGKILSVHLRKPDGKSPYYKIKLLQDGNVRIVKINARAR